MKCCIVLFPSTFPGSNCDVKVSLFGEGHSGPLAKRNMTLYLECGVGNPRCVKPPVDERLLFCNDYLTASSSVRLFRLINPLLYERSFILD